tara:strand:- start:519 stop:1040 length:522 start_codon:yes stop_codon:yes gene_type:complete
LIEYIVIFEQYTFLKRMSKSIKMYLRLFRGGLWVVFLVLVSSPAFAADKEKKAEQVASDILLREVSIVGSKYIENRGDFVDAYLGAIRSRLELVKRYPNFAKRAGMVGEVFVKFTLTQFGDPKDIILMKACPFKRLNDEALNAVKRAAPFPEFPAALRKKEINVTIPFLFQLN